MTDDRFGAGNQPKAATELSFLLELLLNHKLPRTTQLAIKARIDEVQTNPQNYVVKNVPVVPSSPVPVAPIAQTPEVAQALAQRQAMVAQALSGSNEPGRTSPRKIGRP